MIVNNGNHLYDHKEKGATTTTTMKHYIHVTNYGILQTNSALPLTVEIPQSKDRWEERDGTPSLQFYGVVPQNSLSFTIKNPGKKGKEMKLNKSKAKKSERKKEKFLSFSIPHEIVGIHC